MSTTRLEAASTLSLGVEMRRAFLRALPLLGDGVPGEVDRRSGAQLHTLGASCQRPAGRLSPRARNSNGGIGRSALRRGVGELLRVDEQVVRCAATVVLTEVAIAPGRVLVADVYKVVAGSCADRRPRWRCCPDQREQRLLERSEQVDIARPGRAHRPDDVGDIGLEHRHEPGDAFDKLLDDDVGLVDADLWPGGAFATSAIGVVDLDHGAGRLASASLGGRQARERRRRALRLFRRWVVVVDRTVVVVLVFDRRG